MLMTERGETIQKQNQGNPPLEIPQLGHTHEGFIHQYTF